MRAGAIVSIAAFALASVSGSACAMSPPSKSDLVCRVSGENKLPAEIGGGEALCRAIESALAAKHLKHAVSVEVNVRSRFSLAAAISRDGRPLPELTMDVSDRAINAGSIRHFAESIAEAAAAQS